MDFGENYSCRYQNEVQSAFCDTNQVIILPTMDYYLGPGENNYTIMKQHSILGISEDVKHDAHAVHMFRCILQEILKKEIPNLKTIFEWTDVGAAEYKGENSFADISHDRLQIQRNVFETSHGKNVCDGLGATVKNSCHQAVLSGKSGIGNAKELYNYCGLKLCVKDRDRPKRDFVFVPSDAIERNRPYITSVCTLVENRKLHPIRWNTSDCSEQKS